jgi:DOPA 4,5-dioxygenase
MYESYHAHIYYDAATRRSAAKIRKLLEENFQVEMGRWRDEPVGPHPQSMYQVAFRKGQFPKIVPWLMENRAGLTVLVHPNSGDDYGDHAERAIWMGRMLRLRLGFFKR